MYPYSELGHSYPFEIKNKVHQQVAKALIKGFYFQRISTDLPETYAGIWKRRQACETDNQAFDSSICSYFSTSGG
jgi:endoglucanase